MHTFGALWVGTDPRYGAQTDGAHLGFGWLKALRGYIIGRCLRCAWNSLEIRLEKLPD